MGANEDMITFEARNGQEAMKVARDAIEESRYRDGNEYSGCLGMAQGIVLAPGEKALTEKEAYDFCFGTEPTWDMGPDRHEDKADEGFCKKWGPAVLVRIKNPNGAKRKWFLGALCSS